MTASDDARVAALDWSAIGADLDAWGVAVVPGLVDAASCTALATGYRDDGRFRNRVVMARHGYGRGEYKYYAYPLPTPVDALRRSLYAPLAVVANRWNETLGRDERYPDAHDDYLRACHTAGQALPTPLLLRYGAGDYNCLHQDLYGDLAFPLQVAVLLSRPGADFSGGEFVVTEQRPRRQSRVEVVALQQGDAAIFAVNQRPVAGANGVIAATLRHGVSRIRSGRRTTLGIIFHDARA